MSPPGSKWARVYQSGLERRVDVAEASDAKEVGVKVPSPAGGSRQPASPRTTNNARADCQILPGEDTAGGGGTWGQMKWLQAYSAQSVTG